MTVEKLNSLGALNLEEPESTTGRVRELRGLWNGWRSLNGWAQGEGDIV